VYKLKNGTNKAFYKKRQKNTTAFYLREDQQRWLEKNSNGNVSRKLRILIDQQKEDYGLDAAIDMLEEIQYIFESKRVQGAAKKLKEALEEEYNGK